MVLAGAGADDVALGREHFERLEYDRAVVVLGRALARDDLSADERVGALETLAFSYVILGDDVNAERTFHRLLDVSPAYAVAAAQSPRLREAFERARATWPERRDVRLALADGTETIEGTLSGDADRVGGAIARGESGAKHKLRCEGRRCTGDRPGEPFFVDVLDRRGAVITTSGPFEGRSSGIAWWIWAAVGAAVIAGGVTIGLVAAGGSPPDGTLGHLGLP